jgi:hypothetical protein
MIVLTNSKFVEFYVYPVAAGVTLAFFLWGGNTVRKALEDPSRRKRVGAWISFVGFEVGWLCSMLYFAWATRAAPTRTMSFVCWTLLGLGFAMRLGIVYSVHVLRAAIQEL